MHISCAIMKDVEIGKAKQDQGAVMDIYYSVLNQLKEQCPHLESIIDKFGNAGCYHNEFLFGISAWKVHWPRWNLNLKILKARFNERQSSKDQCSILLTVATILTVLIRFLKQCSQQQPYVVLQQMYWISEPRSIKNRHNLKYFQKQTMSKTF